MSHNAARGAAWSAAAAGGGAAGCSTAPTSPPPVHPTAGQPDPLVNWFLLAVTLPAIALQGRLEAARARLRAEQRMRLGLQASATALAAEVAALRGRVEEAENTADSMRVQNGELWRELDALNRWVMGRGAGGGQLVGRPDFWGVGSGSGLCVAAGRNSCGAVRGLIIEASTSARTHLPLPLKPPTSAFTPAPSIAPPSTPNTHTHPHHAPRHLAPRCSEVPAKDVAYQQLKDSFFLLQAKHAGLQARLAEAESKLATRR